MTSLNDIGLQQWSLQIGNKTIEGGGLSAHHIMYLMDRFPLVAVLFGSTEGIAEKLGDPLSIIKTFPDAVCAVFAICTGYEPGDQEGEKAASKLPLIAQIKLLKKIVGATIGEEGVGPFVATLAELTTIVTIPEKTKDANPAAPVSTSRPRSPAALHLELPPSKRGPTRRVA